MKLLDICSSIPSKGIHHYAGMVSLAFHKSGLEVKVVSSPGEADYGIRAKLEMNGIEVIDLPWPEGRSFYDMLRSAAFLSHVLQDFRPDIIHTWGLSHTLRLWLGLKKSKINKKIPIVTTLSSIRHGKIEEWPARMMAARILNVLPGKVCVQCSSEKFKMIKAGMHEERLKVIFHPIDPSFYSDNSSRKAMEFKEKYDLNGRNIIVNLAQFHPIKGQIFLLKAAKQIVQRYPECVFVLAGDGPLLNHMQKKAALLGLVDSTIFLGRIPIDDVPALLRISTMGVVCSLSETFGLAIVEPLSVGIPVVTTNVGVAWDLARNRGVAVVPPRDHQALAKAIIRYIENPQDAIAEAEKGKTFVLKNCKFNNFVQNYIKVFQECLS